LRGVSRSVAARWSSPANLELHIAVEGQE